MVRNRQYDLTPREEELMDMMWQANRPMSRAELRNMPVERSWKDNYLPVMLQAQQSIWKKTSFPKCWKPWQRLRRGNSTRND